MRVEKYLLLLFILSPLFSVSQVHPLSRLAQEFAYELEIEEDRLSNEGGEFLLFEATKATFFMVGEEHGVSEVPKVIWAIYNHAYSMGLRFNHLAIEVSPSMAILLEDMALESNSVEGMQRYASNHPGEIPFYDLKEEQEMLSKVMTKAASSEYVLWGLDQEFLLSSRSILQQLVDKAPNKKTERIAIKYLRQAERGYEAAIQGEDPSTLFLFTVTDGDIQTLQTAYAEDQDALSAITALAESREIYKLLQAEEVSASNQKREQLMKRNFRKYYENEMARQTRAPRVMAKLGAWHLYNGKKPGIEFASLGKYIFDYARKNKLRPFNLMIIGGDEGMLTSRTRNMGWEQKEGIAKEEWLAPFVDIVPKGQWIVFDLREIRPYLGRYGPQIDPRLEKLIREYDSLLILGGSTPATHP